MIWEFSLTSTSLVHHYMMERPIWVTIDFVNSSASTRIVQISLQQVVILVTNILHNIFFLFTKI